MRITQSVDAVGRAVRSATLGLVLVGLIVLALGLAAGALLAAQRRAAAAAAGGRRAARRRGRSVACACRSRARASSARSAARSTR